MFRLAISAFNDSRESTMKDQATILIVEDNAVDGMLLRHAFTKAGVLNPVWIVVSAEEAIAYLKGVDKYDDRAQYPLPGLILLDLQLPGMTGHGFLAWLRAQPDLNALRVVVLSGSDNLRDINLAYELGASSFVTKPANLEHLVKLARALHGYWLSLNQLPEVVRPLYDLSRPPIVTIGR
jgi:CheY-like chemotaxis protein